MEEHAPKLPFTSILSLPLLFFFLIYFIFKLYIIVLVLPNIKMNPPQVFFFTLISYCHMSHQMS